MNEITSQQESEALAVLNNVMTQATNQAAARGTFADHTTRKIDNTIQRKQADLALFESLTPNNSLGRSRPKRGLSSLWQPLPDQP